VRFLFAKIRDGECYGDFSSIDRRGHEIHVPAASTTAHLAAVFRM